MSERKKSLAIGNFLYYYKNNKESVSIKSIFRSLLIISLIVFTFQLNVFADIKEDSAKEYRQKGHEAQQKGKFDEALSSYTKAASLASEPSGIYNDIGVIYEKLGLFPEAERYYLKAIYADSRYMPAYTNLALLYEREGRLDRAAEYLKKRIEWGDPKDPWTKAAKDKLYQIARKSPKLSRWLERQSIKELNRNLEKKAKREFYEQVVESKKIYKKGVKLAKNKEYGKALEEFNRALSLNPHDPKILDARNKALIRLTQEKVREHSSFALRLLELGDAPSAKLEIRKILAIIPNEPIQISK